MRHVAEVSADNFYNKILKEMAGVFVAPHGDVPAGAALHVISRIPVHSGPVPGEAHRFTACNKCAPIVAPAMGPSRGETYYAPASDAACDQYDVILEALGHEAYHQVNGDDHAAKAAVDWKEDDDDLTAPTDDFRKARPHVGTWEAI